MPFLLGIFGPLTQSKKNRLSSVVTQLAQNDSIQSFICDNGVAYAGYKKDMQLSADTIIPLADNKGLFVGKVFDRQTFAPAYFTSLDAQAITHDPKLMLKNWWGRYIGVVHNKDTQRSTLLRDPQGLLSLFYLAQTDGVIFSTDLSLLYDFLEEKPSLDTDYFMEYLHGINDASSLTPFAGIQELLPGMGLHIQANGACVQEQLWDLSECAGSFITDTNAFEEELLSTLQLSVKAWVKDSSGVCLELSGGADSSGLMILLRNVLPDHKIIGVNYIDSKTPSSNEIEHAQEVADVCNVPLYFHDWQNSSLLDPLPISWRPNKPNTFLMFNKAHQRLDSLAREHGCSEIINGHGGDHVFLAPQPINAVADYWLDKGFRGITSPMKELSSTNRMPWWMLAKDTIKSIAGYYGKKNTSSHESTAYFDPSLHYSPKEDSFYLNSSIKNFYPAKKKHVKNLFHAMAFADRNQRMATRTITHPLLSQPIVEMGLKIPTYQSFKHGYDRIFFRNSVSRIKKPGALWRTMKGETTGSMAKSLAAQASEIQDIILQGYFAKNGILNREWFIHEIAKIRHGHVDNLWPVIRFLMAQLWLNQWKL